MKQRLSHAIPVIRNAILTPWSCEPGRGSLAKWGVLWLVRKQMPSIHQKMTPLALPYHRQTFLVDACCYNSRSSFPYHPSTTSFTPTSWLWLSLPRMGRVKLKSTWLDLANCVFSLFSFPLRSRAAWGRAAWPSKNAASRFLANLFWKGKILTIFA